MERIAGKWRIAEMGHWDQKTIDLVGPAFIEFNGQGGQFRFIAVVGGMHCHHQMKNGQPSVEFTWDGNDECDPANGRGWAKLTKAGVLSGRFYIHQGDASGFKAVPVTEADQPAKAASRPGRRRR